MKIAYQFCWQVPSSTFRDILEIVLCTSKQIDPNEKLISNENFIYIKYNERVYKFDRYDPDFIEKVEQSRELNPYKYYPEEDSWGVFHIFEMDPRFQDKRYYNIKRNGRNQEFIEIDKDKIIEDMYNKVIKDLD